MKPIEFIDRAERAYLPDGSGSLDLPIGTNEAIAALKIQTEWGRDVAEWMRGNSAVKNSFDRFRANKRASET